VDHAAASSRSGAEADHVVASSRRGAGADPSAASSRSVRELTMRRLPATLHDIGTWLFVGVVLAVAGVVSVSFAMNTAADDLRQEVNVASGAPLDHPRSAPGIW